MRRRIRSALLLALGCSGVFASAAFAAPPPNDDFTQARFVRVGATYSGTLKNATRERGEPRHAGLLARSVWYRFRAKRKMAVRLNTCWSEQPNTVVAVYRGRSLGSLRAVDFNNGGCGTEFAGSIVTFTARRGRSYSIAVAALKARWPVRLKLQAIKPPRNDDFSDAVPILLGSAVSATTQNGTLELGERRYLAGHRTVWFRLRVPKASEVRLDACNGRVPTLSVFTGARVSRLSPVTAVESCVARFAARPGIVYRVAAQNYGRGGKFRLRARLALPPPNDDFAAAIPITLGATIHATMRDSSRERGEPIYIYSPFSIWFRLTLDATTDVSLACVPATQSLALYRGDQIDQLTPAAPPSICDVQLQLQPGTYSIQFEGDQSEPDFTFSTQAVTPAP